MGSGFQQNQSQQTPDQMLTLALTAGEAPRKDETKKQVVRRLQGTWFPGREGQQVRNPGMTRGTSALHWSLSNNHSTVLPYPQVLG